eukprot:2895843-Rhodomonas_salina.1
MFPSLGVLREINPITPPRQYKVYPPRTVSCLIAPRDQCPFTSPRHVPRQMSAGHPQTVPAMRGLAFDSAV